MLLRHPRRGMTALVLGLLLSSFPARLAAAADATPERTATVSGRVSNAATGVRLEGARVELIGSGRSTTTDGEGRYLVPVSAADTAVVISYPGLDPVTVPLRPGTGGALTHDVALTAEVYRLQPFTVEGDREGTAMATTRQRQAQNVKNIVATDAFGTMTEDNVGAFLQKIPGIVATDVSGSGVREVMVRGIEAGLNTVEMDGVQLANNNSTGTNRAFDFFQASLSLIESIEVTKAPTPDRPANSIGGAINMVTRSSFNRNAPRQLRYSFGFAHLIGRHGGDTEQWIDAPIDRLTPSVMLAYSDVLGRERNLGLSLSYSRNSVFYSSNDTEHYYQGTLARPAYLYRTRQQRQAMGGPHVRQNLGAKLEYKLSERSLITFNAAHNFYLERPHTLAFNLQTTNNANQMRPGYSERYTEVLPSNSAAASMTANAYDNFTHNYRFLVSATHRRPGLVLDATATLSLSQAFQNFSPDERKYDGGVRTKGNLSIGGLTGVGWITDRRQDEVFPQITQTAGRDFYNLASYTTLTLAQNNRIAKSSILEARANLRKDFAGVVPFYVKAGLLAQQQERRKDYHYHQYTFVGPGGLGQFAETAAWTREAMEGMRQAPWIDLYRTSRHKDENPAQWTESVSYRVSQRLQNLQDFSERISAAYLQGNIRLRELSVLAGVRFEETATSGNGPLYQLNAAERARRAAWVGPVTDAEAERRAVEEWGRRTHAEGRYTNAFPGVHLTWARPGGLVARASYTTSIGRPPVTSLIPNTTVNDDAQTVTAANTALKPQFSDNFDLNLEYYFKSIGFVSVSAFQKNVEGFIYSSNSTFVGRGPDNGFDGLYEGYRLTTSFNGGSARYRGLEFSYSQQFTFLPGFWRGLGVNLNFTRLETRGDYGGTVATTQVPGFRPRSANAVLNYQQGRYRASIQANWIDAYLLTTSTNAALLVYEAARTSLNFKFTFDLSSRTSLYFNADNLLRTPINSRYYAYEDRIGYTRLPYRSISAGVQGRF
ncbi:MAG: TonB-dependent receptor [Verrucomicrobia bacterium]|nr:TonB-dependent receptor [Verrucomicrobiota bacterium]